MTYFHQLRTFFNENISNFKIPLYTLFSVSYIVVKSDQITKTKNYQHQNRETVISMFDLQSLKYGEIAIFAGAGISKDSGLPLANELKKWILSKLMTEKEDIEEIMHSGIPFEYFIHSLPLDINEKIFKIFKYGEPNTNHILIAKLAKLGIVKNILTTNFDILFEKALKSEKIDFST